MGGPQEVPSSCSHLFLNLGRCISPHPRARLAERSEERFLGWCLLLSVESWKLRLSPTGSMDWGWQGESFFRHLFSLRILVRSHSLLL